MNKLVVCGDSFAKGIGCKNLKTLPYGSLLSDKLSMPIINLAKGSSTNFSIYLQAKYALEKYSSDIGLLLATTTTYDRLDWFPYDNDVQPEISNLDVNYHEYPPYHESSYMPECVEDHPMIDEVNYTGSMFTDNIMGIIDYWENFGSTDTPNGYYQRFQSEPRERMKLLYDYGLQIHDHKIDRIKSLGVYSMIHILCKRANVKHIIGVDAWSYDLYSEVIDQENLVILDWSKLSTEYPDTIGSLHTSEQGHVMASKIMLNKIKSNTWEF